MDDCDYKHPTGATRTGSLPERRDGRLWETGDVRAGADERVADEGPSWEVWEGGNFVIEFCAGICPTAKACMLVDQHRKLVGCDLDSDILSTAEPDLHFTFALRRLSPSSDITGAEEVRAAARTFKGRVAVVSACKRATAWEA